MKKSNLFIVSAAAVLFLAACGTGGNTGNDSSAANPTTSQGGAASSNHKHSYGEWTTTKEPTCTEKGQKERTCECGEKQTQDIATVDHTYGEWKETKAPTCDADGEKERACTVCGAKETEAVKSTGHAWGEDTEVAASDGKVAYKTAFCTTADKAMKVEFAALDGTWAQGSQNKSGTPDGYLKISKNDMSISYKFDFNRTGKGKIYAFGCMDYWDSANSTYNVDRSFFNDGTPNFAITANGADVEITNKKTYGEMLTGPDASYSEDGLMEIGAIELVAGTNEVVMTRKGSYNPLIKNFVIVLDEYSDEVSLEPTLEELVEKVNAKVATAAEKESSITNGTVAYKSSWSSDFENTSFKIGKDAAGKPMFTTTTGSNSKYYYYDGDTPAGYSVSDYGSGPNYNALNGITEDVFKGQEFGSYMVTTDYSTKYYGAASAVAAMVGYGSTNPNQDTVIALTDTGFTMSYMFKHGDWNWYKVNMAVTFATDGVITGFEFEWANMYSSQITTDIENGTFYVNEDVTLTYNKSIYEGKTDDLGILELPVKLSDFYYTSYSLYNGDTKINEGDTMTVALGDNAITVDVKDINPTSASDSFDSWTIEVTDADGNAVSGYNYYSSYGGKLYLNAIKSEGTYNVKVSTKNTTMTFKVVATAPLPQSINFLCAYQQSEYYFDTTGPAKSSLFIGDVTGIHATVSPSAAAQGTTLTVTAPEGVTAEDYTFTPKTYSPSWGDPVDYYEFSSTKAGTFTFTATSTADPTVTSTHTITVTKPLTPDQIFSGKYCYYNQRGDMLYLEMTFTPNTGTEAEGDGTVEIKSHMAGEKTGVYSYVADGAKAVKLTYVSGDDFIFDGSFQSDGDRDSMSITYKQTADDSWDNTYSLWTWEKYQSLIGA